MVTNWIEKPLGSDNLALFDYDNLSSTTSLDYRFKYITLENINDGKVNKLIECVYRSAPSRARRVVHKDDILIATVRPLLHSHYFVDEEVRDIICSTGFCVVKTDEEQLHNKYLYQLLFSPLIDSQIEAITAGSSYPAINSNDVKKLIVPLPAPPEQRVIAAALSDADAYIAALEKLIAKKRAVKQGVTQELLTGKRRLPGYSEEWVERTLEEVTNRVKVGLATSVTQYYRTQGVVMFRNLNIKENYLDDSDILYLDTDFASMQEGKTIRANDILTVHTGYVGISCVVPEKYDGALTFTTLITTATPIYLIPEYLCYHLNSSLGKREIESLQAGCGRNNLNVAEFLQYKLRIPKDTTEQTAIVAILSDMDAEINALTAKLNKAKHIKQGMMSELLSGRIRLVKQEATAEAAAAPKIVELPRQETKGHNQQFDDAVTIAGIVNVLYSDKFPLGRKKVQKCLYLLRRHQDESTKAFKKKAAGPYADEVRYKGGEPIARSANYIATTTTKDKGTTFARGKNISQALEYIESWGKQGDFRWIAEKLKFRNVDELELLATVDMAICDLEEAGTPVSVAAIKHLIATNAEWKEKLKRQTFSDTNIARAIRELQTLL